ncbi:hypothetical protein C8R44DRAFT_883096 [Mycena epipterygia]|nr:hypothetical protein C8R44DRAFT_883096 [Mycena epipterygia]
MSGMSFQETRRLFGPLNNPANDTNARHRAFLRKGLELFTAEQLQAAFDQPTKLRLTMGSGMNSNALGQIKTHFIRNERLVARETDIPDAASRRALAAYREAYDEYFFKRGNDYSVRNVHALPALQTAEQAWHNYILAYRVAHGMGPRPHWALEPLPGLQRVRTPAPDRRRPQLAFPTPPPTSPVATETPVGPQSPRVCPLSSQLARGLPKKTKKRKRSATIEVIDVSDSEDDRPRKKMKINFLGFVDLTK